MALAELAARQWGVVSLAQLGALGIGSRAAQRRAQAGRLRRVHRGVYAMGGAVLPREGRWLAAVMACGQGAVLSHVSAAVHWNLLNYEPARPEVTAPASHKGVPGIRLHRSHSLDAQDTTNHQGIRTTTLARTLLDIAAHVPQHHLERALAQASACSSTTTPPSTMSSNEPTATAPPRPWAKPSRATRSSRAESSRR